MTALSQSLLRLSMQLPLSIAMIALAGPAAAGGAPAKPSPYYGRWTVVEDKPIFTSRGILYKTIDVGPCGHDFCGVSVSDRGACGATLFRVAGRLANAQQIFGRGKWGAEQKNVQLFSGEDAGGSHNGFEVYLGDSHDFTSRSASMPKFHANYKRLGGAKCVTK